jgi:superfamily II DNA helicase RecQ
MHLTLAPWDETAITAIIDALEAYIRHRTRQLDQMTDYAEADGCRRRIVLQYFSDRDATIVPHCCDNCGADQMPVAAPRDLATIPRSERAALIILDTVKRLPWSVGRRRIADILKASHAKGMTDIYRQQTYYGRFAEFSRKAIEAMIEHLIVQGYLKIVGGDMPVVTLTPQGREALQARAPIALELPDLHRATRTTRPTRTDQSRSITVAETKALFRQGMSPARIAAERGLSEQTIFKHLATLIGVGQLELTAVVSEKVAVQVHAVIDDSDDLSRLAPLKERLPHTISYGEVRCVVADVQRQQRKGDA